MLCMYIVTLTSCDSLFYVFPGNSFTSLIDQDKFMSETWSHWYLGGDNSGDVMVWRNVVEMRTWLKEEVGDVHLVSDSYPALCMCRAGISDLFAC